MKKLIAMILTSAAVAMAAPGKLVRVPANLLFVPVGFDDNDSVEVVVDGYLPDPCHKLRTPDVTVNQLTKKIVVTPIAERQEGVCPDMIVPYSTVVNVGALPEGNYTVESFDGKLAERLAVKVASAPGPDDYLYAPIDTAHVAFRSGGKMRAVLNGRFTNSCLVIDTVKVINSGKTFEVLPVMKKLEVSPEGKPCENVERPFSVSADLPDLLPGRYLLHVRSLNGRSVNEVFTNIWNEDRP